MAYIMMQNFWPNSDKEITNNFIRPLKKPFQVAETLILISLSLV